MGRIGIDDIEDLRGLKLDPNGREELLRTATECTFAFHSTEGWPSAVVLSYLYDNDRLWLTAVRGRAHVRAMAVDPRATVVVSSTGTGLPRCMVALRGEVHLRDDRTTMNWFLPRFAARHASDDPGAFIRLLDSPGRVVFEFAPSGIAASHDSRKLPGNGRGS